MTSDEWFDKHVNVDVVGFNNKQDKENAEDLKEKLRDKIIIYGHMLAQEMEDDETS